MITPYKILTFIVAAAAIYSFGYIEGKRKAESKYTSLQLEQLQTFINTSKNLTKQAQIASLALEKVVSDVHEANIKSTRDIRDALKSTAHIRVSCTFDDRVMQQLETSRRNAATAAATGYFKYALPTASSYK